MPEPLSPPAVEMTAKPSLPGRSLLEIKWAQDEQGRWGIETLCDCAGWCLHVIEDLHRLTEPQDVALSCPGCNTVTWITIGPVGADA